MIEAISNIDDNGNEIKSLVQMNERETEFLKLICTELTYKEIADRMQVSYRTIDNYRDLW